MNRNRSAAFTPLHRPNYERRPFFSGALERRALKRHKCRAPNPNGIPSISPGLPSPRGYPGSWSRAGHNPNGVASFVACQSAATPLGLMGIFIRVPRVARASQPWAERRYPFGVIPIPALVERILAVKQRDAGADTSALERELDELVSALYGLTPEEIQLVEGAAK